MKSGVLKGAMVAGFAAALALSSPASAGVLLGTGTLDTANDLTRIGTGGSTLEFLDLSVTKGMSVADAVAAYDDDGFSWATGAQVAELFSAFGIYYRNVANDYVDLGALYSQRSSFVSYLGKTTTLTETLGWLDDLTTATAHTFACIGVGTEACSPGSFVWNTTAGWPSDEAIGVFLVRSVTVPEPGALALLGLGLAGLSCVRRRRAAPSR